MILLNNSLSIEQVQILMNDRPSSPLDFNPREDRQKQIDDYIEMLRSRKVSGFLLSTGAAIFYRYDRFFIHGYTSDLSDVLPLLQYLEIEPEVVQ